MKKRLRSPAVLLVVFAMVLVAAGIGYAHWSSFTRIEASVNTGNFDIGWGEAGTNDDGDPDNDLPGGSGDGDTGTLYDGTPTADDPSSGLEPWLRYEKDVAECYAGPDGDALRVDIHNGYPSYHCSVFAEVYNHGSVPAIPGFTSLVARKGYTQCDLYDQFDAGPLPVGWDEEAERHFVDFDGEGDVDPGVDYYIDYTPDGIFDEYGNPMWEDCYLVPTSAMFGTENPLHPGEFEFGDGDGVVDFTFHVEEGVLCDPLFQIDPQEAIPVSGWIHLEQGAEQNVTYEIVMETEWINWNEWTPGFCIPAP